jgi:hypothetical protein
VSILGQVADTKTNPVLYQVPAGKSALVTKIWVFDDENVARNYTLRVVPSGQTEGDRHNILRATLIQYRSGNGYFEVQHPLMLGPGTQVVCIPGVAGGLPDRALVFGEEAVDTTTYAPPVPNTLLGTTLADLYTVPAGKKLAVASLIVTNADTSNARRVWLSVAKAGAADTGAQYLLVNYRLEPGDVYWLVGGLTLDAGDVVRGRADVANAVAVALHGVLQ